MTDRELLELAAKASGELTPSWYGNESYFKGVLDRWNPLTDDGDAFRLAVKLRLGIVHGWGNFPEETALTTVWISHDGKCVAEEVKGHDEYAATRRAIVRAAADIGRSMR